MFKVNSVHNVCSSFSWTKDGVSLTLSDSMKVLADNGTLIIMSPGPDDEGLYQCFASTAFGVASSVSFELRQACKSVSTSCVTRFFVHNYCNIRVEFVCINALTTLVGRQEEHQPTKSPDATIPISSLFNACLSWSYSRKLAD